MANFKGLSDNDYYLINGIKININSQSTDNKFTVSEMDAAKKLALGIGLDINNLGGSWQRILKEVLQTVGTSY